MEWRDSAAVHECKSTSSSTVLLLVLQREKDWSGRHGTEAAVTEPRANKNFTAE
jgi:hypothetical protein